LRELSMSSEGNGTTGPPGDPEQAGDAGVHLDAEGTLGGYVREHKRPPGFEGLDGEPYTVSLEVERTPNLAAPHEGYLVFPRWAATGLGVVAHLETPTLCRGRSRDAVIEELGELPLRRVKELLDEAILRREAPKGPTSGQTQ
jgi:hypothetical protein